MAYLHLEDVVVEEELKLFVSKVDQELFKRVVLKLLKAENVKDT